MQGSLGTIAFIYFNYKQSRIDTFWIHINKPIVHGKKLLIMKENGVPAQRSTG
jgi:hypothetical protein